MSADGAMAKAPLWLGALVGLTLLPFASRAVGIDGPVFVEVALQILSDPFDPFGFEMVWDPTSPEAAVFNRNPPLLSYWLAPFLGLFGESDLAIHLALLPFPLMAAYALFGVARRLCGDGLGPTLLLVTTPAFVVLSTALLLDVPMLAFLLIGVYALLRAREAEGSGWQWAAGAAAAAAGMMKYVGFCAAPLLGAGALLLFPRKAAVFARIVGVPLACWALWGAFTLAQYGEVHFLGSSDVVTNPKKWQADHFWNHTASTLVFYGGALVFPIALWGRVIVRTATGIELAVLGALLGTVVVYFVLPEGEPPRRVELSAAASVLGALGFAAGFMLVARFVRPKIALGAPEDRLLWLWLGGVLFFSMLMNWHVNAADALLAAPPILLLLFRDVELRPGRGFTLACAALMLPLSMGLAWADAIQSGTYRAAASAIGKEIGTQSGARYYVGQWGLQHYLSRQEFAPVVPPMYGRTDLAAGDWVATARNVAQLDVTQNLGKYRIAPVWQRSFETWLPLRTTNADAGAGFYSHHVGHVPWMWSTEPVEHIQLGRVRGRR
jgi:4-amino-4-deoxy-L-arabinose transferase-like glycosyltransferase